ncbi:MAG: zf-HC2 domain-containing protein, partial [candidate division NC10 bacterium]|nr:zf-HC2 domain-containing protein [candidate division NC10 bacterium]
MLTCKDVIMDVLADYLEATLRPEAVADLERHLQACAPCMAYLKTRDLVHLSGQVAMPEEMKVILRRFMREQ